MATILQKAPSMTSNAVLNPKLLYFESNRNQIFVMLQYDYTNKSAQIQQTVTWTIVTDAYMGPQGSICEPF